MISLWKIIRNLSAMGGFGLLFCATSTSDYYVLELGQAEPSSVWTSVAIGFALLMPTIIHAIFEELKGDKQ